MTFVLANSLSPVMWLTIALLFSGNAIIGIIEGIVVSCVFRFPPIRTTLLFIVANYASMWFGIFLFGIGEQPSPLPETIFAEPLNNASSLIWICIAISFAVSCIIEFPFCWIASRLAKAPFKKSVLAVLLAQSVSYPLLMLLFYNSKNTIGDEVVVATLNEVIPDSLKATIYFIGEGDGSLYEVQINGSGLKLLKPIKATDEHDVLGWLPPQDSEYESDSKSNAWQLILDRQDVNEVLFEKPKGRCEAFLRSPDLPLIAEDGWWLKASGIADLRHPDKRDWSIEPNGNHGIWAKCKSTNDEIEITFDTPFVSWWGRCITILPGDIAVFELGKQVCVLSVQTRKIAFLARGRGPVVLLEESKSDTESE